MDALEKKIEMFWLKAEKDLGYPIPQEARDIVEKVYLHGIQTRDDLEDLQSSWVEIFSPFAGNLNPQYNRQSGNEISSAKTPYEKPLKRRLYLVTWVDNKKGEDGRIDWEALTTKWNKEHPHDPIKDSANFNATYHRAKSDPDVQREYAKRQHPEYTSLIEKLALRAEIDDRARAESSMFQELGRTALYYGQIAMASTAEFVRILENLPQTEPQKVSIGDFSKNYTLKGGQQ